MPSGQTPRNPHECNVIKLLLKLDRHFHHQRQDFIRNLSLVTLLNFLHLQNPVKITCLRFKTELADTFQGAIYHQEKVH